MLAQPPGSPLRGKYLVRNAAANRLLYAVDFVLKAVVRRRGAAPPAAPRRILLANGAHLGDVLLSTAMLPALKEAFPDAETGFLLGSWSREVLADHPLVTRLHVVDHWKLNRANLPLRRKLSQYRNTRATALRQIRECRYDAAIDLYYYFPNSIPLLWKAGIPTRIGYTSGGFGPLLTHALDWRDGDRHVIDYQADLLAVLAAETAGDWRSRLAPVVRPGATGPSAIPWDDYLVLHPGAGAAHKAWPAENWRAVAKALLARGHRLVFTGHGEAETRQIEVLIAGLHGCRSLCGRLAWRDFVAVVAGARLAVGVESVVGHVAAAVGAPCVVVYGGVTNPAHWRPWGERVRVLTQPTPCAPCYHNGGCAGMECVRQVETGRVLAAIDALLAAHPGERARAQCAS